MSTEHQFAICVQNEGYPASLELWKIYRVVPDHKAAKHQLIRIVDESGEDYLYAMNSFVKIELPKSVERSILRQGSRPNGSETSDSLPELSISRDDWIVTKGQPTEIVETVKNSRAAIVFHAAGKELPIEAEPALLIRQLNGQRFVVGWQNQSSFPGPPYFEALIALVPPGAILLPVVRDLLLAWLQGRREREIEILIPGQPSVKLKGTDATPQKAYDLLSRLNELQRPKKSGRQRISKKRVKPSTRH